MMKRLLIMLAMVLNLSLALAAVDVTFHGESDFGTVDEFELYAYDCLDSSCTNVRDFSGVMLQGESTNNGTLVVRFPDSLATPHGYALFAVDSDEEFRPLELGPAIVHSHGQTFVWKSDTVLNFDKVSHCRSLVHDMTVVNEAKPNIPLVVAMNAALDAETVSAFRKVDNGIGFIPGYLDDWYSAETLITLEIVDDNTGAVIHQETQELNLYADATERVEFAYVPRTEGRYSARIRSEVTDAACEVVTPESSVKHFAVLDEEPVDACYTLLNNLHLDNAFPETGQSVRTTFNVLSNYADAAGNLEPVDTALQVLVMGPQGQLVYDSTFTAQASRSNDEAVTYGFNWASSEVGLHRITVAGISEDFKCDLSPSTWEVLSTEVFVAAAGDGDDNDQPDPEEFAYDVTFEIRDQDTNESIEDAKVRIVENGFQDESSASGMATIQDLVNGVYTFKVTHDTYESFVGILVIDNEDQSVLVELDYDVDKDDLGRDKTHLSIDSVRMPLQDGVLPGELVELSVNLDNDGDERLDDARATVTILELGVYDTIGPFDVKVGQSFTKKLFVQIPDWAPAGMYNARITVGTGKHSRVLYRQIRVLQG